MGETAIRLLPGPIAMALLAAVAIAAALARLLLRILAGACARYSVGDEGLTFAAIG